MGCDTLVIDSIKVKGPFEVLVGDKIPPFGAGKAFVKFHPDIKGDYEEWLRLYSNDADTMIKLKGYAVGAPLMGLSRDTFTMEIFSCRDADEDSFYIYNSGNEILNWKLSGFYDTLYSVSYSKTIPYTGYSAYFSFYNAPAFADTVLITVTLNGDYDYTHEFASLYINNTLVVDTIDDGNKPSGTTIRVKYGFSYQEFRQWMSGSYFEIWVKNSAGVDPGYGLNQMGVAAEFMNKKGFNLSPVSGIVQPGDSMAVLIHAGGNGLISGLNESIII